LLTPRPVTGGNVANFVGIYTALRSVFPRYSALRTREQIPKATIYASGETHMWIEKAIDLFGFPRDGLGSIGVDSSRRLLLADLESQLLADLNNGRLPVAVVGNAGTVSTGAIDPLPAVAKLVFECAMTPKGRHFITDNSAGSLVFWFFGCLRPPERLFS
jgi:aromatic-L-amino-acid/L-tryptophan decarboxylase